MPKKKRSNTDIQYSPIVTQTCLGKDSVFRGRIKFTESVTIRGQYEGKIETSGFLFIEDGATVHADIRAGKVVVCGVVHGNINAKESVEMLSTCKIYGNITTAFLHIADGVVFEGQCKMITRSEEIDIFAEQTEQIRERY